MCSSDLDGKVRTLERPKKKKKKHVQVILYRNDITEVDDVKIKRILKEWNKEEES